MTEHRLSPLFEARSVAVLGASDRPGSFGRRLARAVLSRGYDGKVTFVNPRGGRVSGRDVLGSIREMDHAPDLAVLGVGVRNLETALLEAIGTGARAAVLFDTCHGNGPDGQPVLHRLRDIAREADIPICGGSGMGVITVPSGLVGSFYPAGALKAGGISLIAHSGSVFTVLGMNDPRYRFDIMASPGQEIGATLDEYITYAATRPDTGAIAVFMESARNPDGFAESLCRARDAGKPVIVCKVGRTEESARLARSHTGALAGRHEAYLAVIEECGAIAVDTVDALMTTALLCSTGRIPGPGGVGLITDSGGLREMQVDLAAEHQVKLAQLTQATRDQLRAALPPGLEPSNPLDCAADLTEDFVRPFEKGVEIFAAAPEVSMLGFEADLRDDYVYEDGLRDQAQTLAGRTDKPIFYYTSFAQTRNRDICDKLTDSGVPCLNGAEAALSAVRDLQSWADARRRDPEPLPEVPVAPPLPDPPDEAGSLSLLSRFGVPVVEGMRCSGGEDVQAAGSRLGFPVALKTAARGLDHKSDANGVILNLEDAAALGTAYEALARRLGPDVIVQKQVKTGVELAFGCVMDRDFGPLVMVAPGGMLVELFADRRFARAPFGPRTAETMIRGLRVARMIDGVREAPASDMAAAALALSRFSVACAALKGQVSEIDVNPVVVTGDGAVAVDALIVP